MSQHGADPRGCGWAIWVSSYDDLDTQYEDAGWVAYRFAEILPVSVESKQRYLEIDDPLVRLREIETVLREIGSEQSRKSSSRPEDSERD